MTEAPADTPVTTPLPLTVATKILVLLHVPPTAVSVSTPGTPLQMDADPVITPATGDAFTVNDLVAVAVQPPTVFA